MVVKPPVLYFHMLAHHIESHLFKHFDIIHHGFIRGRGIDTVRPESLVEGSVLPYETVIKHYAGEAISISTQ